MQRKKIQEAMKNVYFQKMTANGYHEIEEQIAKLQQQRPAKIEQLKAARALGDLSENTEYSTAKRELRHLESRLRYLNKQLQYAEIVTPKNDHTIDLGTTEKPIILWESRKLILPNKKSPLILPLVKPFFTKQLGPL